MKLNGKMFLRAAKMLAVTAAALVCASCANSLLDGEVQSTDSNSRTLNIAITNYSEIASTTGSAAESVIERSAARTIMADSYDASSVKLYIYGETTTGKKFENPELVTFSGTDGSNTKGTITIPSDTGTWEFTLVALDSNDTTVPTTLAEMKENAVMIGYSSLDMTYGDTATFTLSPDGLTKEAAVAMKVYNDGWTTPDTITSITAGIYSLTDGSVINDNSDASTVKTFDSLSSAAPDAANYSIDSIDPGTYLFKVIYTRDNGKIFVWSDTIIVLPGKTIESSVEIPDIIGTAPAAPTDFTAGYTADSEDKSIGYYEVNLNWTRTTSKTELYNEIDILTLADETTALPASDTEWEAAVTAGGTSVTYGDKFTSADCYVSGSLLTGNKTASLRLELGKRYAARIRAVNDAGSSDYAYITLPGTVTTAFTSTVINRYRVTYHLNGGSYYADGDTTGTAPTSDIVVYESEGTYAIIQPDGTTETAVLKNGTATWSAWYDGEGTKYEATSYTEAANLDLYAKYSNGESAVEFVNKADYDIKGSWITIEGTVLGDGAKTATVDYDSLATADTIAVTFKPADDSNKITGDFAYNTVILTLTKGGRTYYATTAEKVGLTGTSFEIPVTTNLATGIYQLTISATYNTTDVSYPVTLTFTR